MNKKGIPSVFIKTRFGSKFSILITVAFLVMITKAPRPFRNYRHFCKEMPFSDLERSESSGARISAERVHQGSVASLFFFTAVIHSKSQNDDRVLCFYPLLPFRYRMIISIISRVFQQNRKYTCRRFDSVSSKSFKSCKRLTTFLIPFAISEKPM